MRCTYQIYRFWLNIFAMAFGVGVVTGIVLSFEFGLGFAGFAQTAGPAIGPTIALKVLTSFFLEAGFLESCCSGSIGWDNASIGSPGVGLLLLFQRDQASRNHMVDSITPTWDGAGRGSPSRESLSWEGFR